jgi:peptidyl-dipeptidase Dcp
MRATQEDGYAFGARFQNNELDNQQNVFKIAKCVLIEPTLGYATHALCEERMAESPEK